jgi:hypothetical protein
MMKNTDFHGGITNGVAWYPLYGGMQDVSGKKREEEREGEGKRRKRQKRRSGRRERKEDEGREKNARSFAA